MKIFLLLALPFLLPVNWLAYTNASRTYTMNYPDDWSKRVDGETVVFLSPKEGDKDSFQENVNLMVQDLTGQPMTLEQYTELTKKQVTDNLGASAIVSLKDVTLAGQPTKELVFNMTYQGKKLKTKQYWFIKDHKAYLFTYTAEPEKYEGYDGVATEMIRSFKFL